MKVDSLQTLKLSRPLYILRGLMYFLTFFEYNLYTRLVTATWTFLLRSSKGLIHVTIIVSFAPRHFTQWHR